MTFSRSTLELFAGLLDQVRLPASDPNIVENATKIAAAKAELAEAVKELPIVVPLASVADEA